jgi:hypothetical protein
MGTSNIPLLEKGINILDASCGRKLPSSAEEGWTRHQKDIAELPYPERTGWCWSINKKMVDQHHYYCFALSRSRFAPVCAGLRWLRVFY